MGEDKIKQFDRELLIANNNQVTKNRINQYISLAIVILLMIIAPVVDFDIEKQISGIVFKGVFVFIATHFYLCPYIYINEKGKNSSIYKKLKYLPWDINDAIKIRFSYLKKYIFKMIIVCVLAHNASCMILNSKITTWSILYPTIIVLVFGMLGGYLDIVFYKFYYGYYKLPTYSKHKQKKKIEYTSKIVVFIVICIVINRSLNFGDKRFLVAEDYSQITYNDQVYIPIDIPDEVNIDLEGDVICEKATVEGQGLLGLVIDSSAIYDVKENKYLLRLKNNSFQSKDNYYCLKSKLSEVSNSIKELK